MITLDNLAFDGIGMERANWSKENLKKFEKNFFHLQEIRTLGPDGFL